MWKSIVFDEIYVHLCMKTVIEIDMKNSQAKHLLNYIETLPFAKVREENKKSFAQAAKECNAVSVKEFTDELRRQIDEHFDQYA